MEDLTTFLVFKVNKLSHKHRQQTNRFTTTSEVDQTVLKFLIMSNAIISGQILWFLIPRQALVTLTLLAVETFITMPLPRFRFRQTIFHRRIWRELEVFSTNGNLLARITFRLILRRTFPTTRRTHHLRAR